MATSHAISALPHKNLGFCLAATWVLARSRVPRPDFADGNGLTCSVCTAPSKQRLPVDFLCNHASKPHQQSLRFYPDFLQYSSNFEGVFSMPFFCAKAKRMAASGMAGMFCNFRPAGKFARTSARGSRTKALTS